MSKRLWITWEQHRRSKELALELSAEYYPLMFEAKRPLRYLVLTCRTIFLLLRKRPKTVFCQNPSIVLTALMTILKSIFRYKLIVDRHSNFKLEYNDSQLIIWRVFRFLSEWTIKRADLTIVTNDHLKRLCHSVGGRAEVLQDKIPRLSKGTKRSPPQFMKKTTKTQVMFVTMFDPDEPIDEIIQASKELAECACYLTGNYRKYCTDIEAEENSGFDIVMTGFVSDEDYLALMENSDLVVVLTKKDLILNCGAYEAISMNKPLILSDTPTLREYFGRAAIYSKCNADELHNQIVRAKNDLDAMTKNVIVRKLKLEEQWTKKMYMLQETIVHIANAN